MYWFVQLFIIFFFLLYFANCLRRWNSWEMTHTISQSDFDDEIILEGEKQSVQCTMYVVSFTGQSAFMMREWVFRAKIVLSCRWSVKISDYGLWCAPQREHLVCFVAILLRLCCKLLKVWFDAKRNIRNECFFHAPTDYVGALRFKDSKGNLDSSSPNSTIFECYTCVLFNNTTVHIVCLTDAQ